MDLLLVVFCFFVISVFVCLCLSAESLGGTTYLTLLCLMLQVAPPDRYSARRRWPSQRQPRRPRLRKTTDPEVCFMHLPSRQGSPSFAALFCTFEEYVF